MGYNQASGMGALLKEGHKHYEGLDEAVAKNIEAVKQLAEITKTSLGPNGMNKLVINHLDKIFVTSDTATFIRELEVVHPAAKLVAMAAKMQENEKGDGTNLVVSIAGELLVKAADLLRMGLHCSEIVTGYKKAIAKTLELLDTMTCHEIQDVRDKVALVQAVKPVLAAKQYGNEDLLAQLVVDACHTVFPIAPKKARVNVDNVRVCKIMGGSIYDSQVIKGMVVQRNTEGSIKHASQAKVVVFGCGIEVSSTEAKSTVLIKNADELMNYNKGEEEKMEEAIRSIAESGAKVLIAGGSVSEMALHFVEKYRLLCVRITSKWELRRLCRALQATALVRLGPPTPEEMGYCDEVHVKEVGGRKVTVFVQDQEEDTAIATIVLRSSTNSVLNDLERAVDDGVNAVKAMCVTPACVPGAGATELELARQIQSLGQATPGLDQYGIQKFGEALEVVPKILAENAGRPFDQVLSNLYAAHAAGKVTMGVNVEFEPVEDFLVDTMDSAEHMIVDHLETKKSALRLGADAAITVLRVDQLIMAKAAGGPKPPGA